MRFADKGRPRYCKDRPRGGGDDDNPEQVYDYAHSP